MILCQEIRSFDLRSIAPAYCYIQLCQTIRYSR